MPTKKKTRTRKKKTDYAGWMILATVLLWIFWVGINIITLRAKLRAIEGIITKKQIQQTLNAYPENFDCCYSSDGQRIQEN